MKRVKLIGEYKLVNKGYRNLIYKNNELMHDITDTFVGAIAFINSLITKEE